MNERKVLQLYTDLGDKIKRLSREDKGALLEAMFAWANDEPLPDDMPLSAMIAWDFVQPMLEAADAKYQEISVKRREAVNKRWENAKEDTSTIQNNTNEYKRIQAATNGCNKEKEKDKDIKEKGFTNVNQKKKSARPTLEEVQEYANEKGYVLDISHFYDYYESNGWRVGRNPMKDWRAALRNWLKNDFDRGKAKTKQDEFEAFMAAEVAKEKAENDARAIQSHSGYAENIPFLHNARDIPCVV